MGDRYELIKNCAYCDTLHEDIYYAPTCGFHTFFCDKCGKRNFIVLDDNFTVKKMGDVTYDDIYDSISQASNMMSEEQIETEAQNVFRYLLKGLKIGK